MKVKKIRACLHGDRVTLLEGAPSIVFSGLVYMKGRVTLSAW